MYINEDLITSKLSTYNFFYIEYFDEYKKFYRL